MSYLKGCPIVVYLEIGLAVYSQMGSKSCDFHVNVLLYVLFLESLGLKCWLQCIMNFMSHENVPRYQMPTQMIAGSKTNSMYSTRNGYCFDFDWINKKAKTCDFHLLCLYRFDNEWIELFNISTNQLIITIHACLTVILMEYSCTLSFQIKEVLCLFGALVPKSLVASFSTGSLWTRYNAVEFRAHFSVGWAVGNPGLCS